MVGTTISHYKVSEKIEQEGMGESFRGFHPLKTLRLVVPFTNRIKTTGGRFAPESGSSGGRVLRGR